MPMIIICVYLCLVDFFPSPVAAYAYYYVYSYSYAFSYAYPYLCL